MVQINSGLNKITKEHPQLILSGSLTSKASYGQLLDTLLTVATVLLSVGGAIVGIGAGAFFGWIGTAAVGTELDYPTAVFSMSAPRAIVVGVVAIPAGVLASILPGWRAARSAPVEALAEA